MAAETGQSNSLLCMCMAREESERQREGDSEARVASMLVKMGSYSKKAIFGKRTLAKHAVKIKVDTTTPREGADKLLRTLRSGG